MILHYDKTRNRVICRWGEPVNIIMNKKSSRMERIRTIAVQLQKDGQLAKRDRERYGEHPVYSKIMHFVRKLRSNGYFPMGELTKPCTICGLEHGSAPHFDTRKRRVVWLCPEHRNELNKSNAN
ncbi:MAG: hypothetical protein ACNI3A_06845 [Desulfovibrio sp.]|uniref:hypothetical protein n=1 Tax=Desulfovibrio sp. 7SRBS1 TaxID=3378064 RepID=UPI003B3D42C3